MNDVKNISVDTNKVKEKGIHEIKPKTDMSVKEAKDFIKNKISEGNINKPSEKLIDGVKHYYDDNGKEYRVGDSLQANSSYEINGYKYQTDSEGRVISAEGKLHLRNREDRLTIKDTIHQIGKGDQRSTDDRGHLIGDQFDGSNGLENIVPQDSQLNHKEYAKMENELAKEVAAGKEVYFKVEPLYENNSHRPDSFAVTYSIDGEKTQRIFSNERDDQ